MAHDEAYLEAENIIEEALKTGATELDLSSMKLTELPAVELLQIVHRHWGANLSQRKR